MAETLRKKSVAVLLATLLAAFFILTDCPGDGNGGGGGGGGAGPFNQGPSGWPDDI